MGLLADARPDRLDPGADRDGLDITTITQYPQEVSAARSVGRRYTRRWALAGLVPVAAAAAVVVAVVLTTGSGGVPATVTGPVAQSGRSDPAGPATLSAQQILLTAARHSQPDTATGGRYWVTRTELGGSRVVGPASRRYTVLTRTSQETWLPSSQNDDGWAFGQELSTAPASPADKAAWRADGSPSGWTEPVPSGMPAGTKPIVIKAAGGPPFTRKFQGDTTADSFLVGGQQMSRAELAALPTDPAALKALLLRKHAGRVDDTTEYLFYSADSIVLQLPVSSQVRAAAYRMLAGLSGVTALGTMKDAHGRAGQAVGYTRRGDGGTLGQTRLIIDPNTGQALAQETWDLGKSGSVTGATLSGYTLVLSVGWRNDSPPASSNG
jgi:hypothetical protein